MSLLSGRRAGFQLQRRGLSRVTVDKPPLHRWSRLRDSEAIEDKVRPLLHGDTGKIDQGITESFIDRSKVVAKLARQGERQRALFIPAIYLLPGRSDEYLRVVAIEMGSILTGRKGKAEKRGVAKNIRYSAVEENRPW